MWHLAGAEGSDGPVDGKKAILDWVTSPFLQSQNASAQHIGAVVVGVWEPGAKGGHYESGDGRGLSCLSDLPDAAAAHMACMQMLANWLDDFLPDDGDTREIVALRIWRSPVPKSRDFDSSRVFNLVNDSVLRTMAEQAVHTEGQMQMQPAPVLGFGGDLGGNGLAAAGQGMAAMFERMVDISIKALDFQLKGTGQLALAWSALFESQRLAGVDAPGMQLELARLDHEQKRAKSEMFREVAGAAAGPLASSAGKLLEGMMKGNG